MPTLAYLLLVKTRWQHKDFNMINYQPSFLFNKIVIVGCGGTGSRLVPMVAQFVKSLPYIINPIIYLVDGDVVEEKNLQRQNFISSDVGKPKAAVLAARYSKAYNIPIVPVNRMIDKDFFSSRVKQEDPMLQTLLGEIYNQRILLILCVDSVAGRKFIVSNWAKTNSLASVVLDAGNENDFGQIKLSSLSLSSVPDEILTQLKALVSELGDDRMLTDISISSPLPDFSYFFDMEPPASALSCADLDQTMAINCLMATYLFSVVQNIFYAKPIPFHRLNISLTHGATPDFNDISYIGETVQYVKDMANSYTRDKLRVEFEGKGVDLLEINRTYNNLRTTSMPAEESMKLSINAARKAEATFRKAIADSAITKSTKAKKEGVSDKPKREAKERGEEPVRSEF